jgi:hypothetical protein
MLFCDANTARRGRPLLRGGQLQGAARYENPCIVCWVLAGSADSYIETLGKCYLMRILDCDRRPGRGGAAREDARQQGGGRARSHDRFALPLIQLQTRLTKSSGASISEAMMRPNPRWWPSVVLRNRSAQLADGSRGVVVGSDHTHGPPQPLVRRPHATRAVCASAIRFLYRDSLYKTVLGGRLTEGPRATPAAAARALRLRRD